MTGSIPAKGQYTEAARAQRLAWLRELTGAPLASLGTGGLDARRLAGNIENFVATVEMPVGLAGPLLFVGDKVRGPIVAPLATTEGALVASASRGARAITRCGGVTTRVLSQRMARAPVWEFHDIPAGARFVRWLRDRHAEIESRVRPVSRHARLIAVDPYQIGRYVHVRFVYETSDAAGQNMTTATTADICRWIGEALAGEPELTPAASYIDGNLSGDKKASQLSLLSGRGTRVTADCILDRATIESVLKTTPEALQQAVHCTVIGAQQAGMLGHSINVSNVVAGLFIATGQDVACVYESSSAIFSVEPAGDGLRATMLLPGLIVGTVGGGTRLPQQQDYLASLGCVGDGKQDRLAEIAAGFALALDLSTIAAVAGGQFAEAHRRLGRPHEVDWLQPGDLDARFLQPLLAGSLGDGLTVTDVALLDDLAGSSIITELSAFGERRKLLGLYPLRVTYSAGGGRTGTLDMVAKVKPLDRELIVETGKLAALCGPRVAQAWAQSSRHTEFNDLHTRELAIYRAGEPRLDAVLPRCYGVYEDAQREAYVILMERLDASVFLLNAADEPGHWAPPAVEAAIRGIAGVHARWLAREDELSAQAWLGQVPGPSRLTETSELWHALAEHNAAEHPELIGARTRALVDRLADTAGEWARELSAMPQTLVHNDFNPRNIALRRNGGARLVAYDWELATVNAPQRDLVELLAFVLTPGATGVEVARYVELHRRVLAAAAGVELDRDLWRRGFELALAEVIMTRLQLYLMAHTHRSYPFLERVVRTAVRLWELT